MAIVVPHARADELYVAPDGDDAHAGTLDAPFASVERAEAEASPGDTVYVRGGLYRFRGTQATTGVSLTKSGREGAPIRYFAYPGEKPIFDLFELKTQARITGLDVHCDYIHVRGFEVRGVRQMIKDDSWGVRIRGNHNVLERLDVHDNEAPGVFIASGAGNRVLNSDSHHNYNPLENGENADGFSCRSSGGDNVLSGCRAYSNSDDGFDFSNAAGTCTVEGSWSFRNGFVPDTMMPAGSGAGFKAGGFGAPPDSPPTAAPQHVVRFNLAFANRSQGFSANRHRGGIDFFQNTAFENPVHFDMQVIGKTPTLKLRNNLAAYGGKPIENFTSGDDAFNSWSLPVSVDAADFAGDDQSEALRPREKDGSLPPIALMHLAPGSDLIDRGEDIGLGFVGQAPDLGAFEWQGQLGPGVRADDDAGMTSQGAPGAGPSALDAGPESDPRSGLEPPMIIADPRADAGAVEGPSRQDGPPVPMGPPAGAGTTESPTAADASVASLPTRPRAPGADFGDGCAVRAHAASALRGLLSSLLLVIMLALRRALRGARTASASLTARRPAHRTSDLRASSL